MARAVVIALLVAACGGGQKEIEVQGKDTELVKLAGEWEGDYKGNESGRSGPVTFSLQLGRHIAEGEVVMGGPGPQKTPLKIEFVQLDGGQIKGTIAPYTDPNCACQVETSFLGKLQGEAIAGMFETKIGATGQIQTGSWRVTRKAK